MTPSSDSLWNELANEYARNVKTTASEFITCNMPFYICPIVMKSMCSAYENISVKDMGVFLYNYTI